MTDSVVLGKELSSGAALSIPRSKLGHIHVRGMTGAGKTSLGILPLIAQLMKPYERNGVACADPIFIFDLGGDSSLFHTVTLLCKEARRTFRFLTLDPELESHFFPPFQAVPASERNALRIAEMLVTA